MTRCGARRPGYDQGPEWGRRTLPCVLDPDHEGVHRSTYGDTWTETDVVDHPANDSVREAGRVRTDAEAVDTELFTVNAAVAQLASLLATPGLPRDAETTWHAAATVWETLDALLRTGGSWPSRWSSPRVDTFLAGIDATPLYGALAASLDVTPPGGGYRVMPLTTLRAAVHTWEALDVVLRAGGRPPEAWSRST